MCHGIYNCLSWILCIIVVHGKLIKHTFVLWFYLSGFFLVYDAMVITHYAARWSPVPICRSQGHHLSPPIYTAVSTISSNNTSHCLQQTWSMAHRRGSWPQKVDWVDLGTSSRAESVTIGAVDPPSNVKFQIQRCNTRVQDSDYIPTEFRFFGHGLGLKWDLWTQTWIRKRVCYPLHHSAPDESMALLGIYEW